MLYNVGMYGGSFDPLHIGHINCIIEAASKCQELYIVLSFSRLRDHIPMEIRYRWLVGSFRHMEHVHVVLLEDDAPTKEAYDTDDYWESGRDKVLMQIKKPVDVVFCGSDYKGSDRYENLYHCPVVYFERMDIPVSSTELRKNPLAHWDWIPDICKPYFVKKVLFVGGESTGKSTIVQNLALAYGTNYLDEVGREVCWKAVQEDTMIEEDFHEILIRHKAKELECLAHSRRILFEDTDAMTTLWFSGFLLDDEKQIARTTALANGIQGINHFDLIFFMEPTVPFVQDGTRNEEIAADREKYSRQIKELLDSHDMKYICLSGNYADRFLTAKEIINQTFQISEV